MKHSEKVLEKLNDLWVLNHELKKTYLEAQTLVTDKDLSVFFRVRAFESHQFANDLKVEIEKLGSKSKASETLKNDFYNFRLNFNNLLFQNDKIALFDEVFDLKRTSIEKYNGLLMEINLPLSTCKLLMRQRDSFQRVMNVIERREASVA